MLQFLQQAPALIDQPVVTSTSLPGLTFGGAAVGMTFGSRGLSYIRFGATLVWVRFNFTLTAKGSSVGTAVLTGFPLTASFTCDGKAGFYSAMTSVNNLLMQINATTTTVSLYDGQASGAVVLTEGDFTDTTSIYGTIIYAGA